MHVKFSLKYHFIGLGINWRKWSIRLRSHLGEIGYGCLPYGGVGLLKQPTLNNVAICHIKATDTSGW
jgi:hypothetical protein